MRLPDLVIERVLLYAASTTTLRASHAVVLLNVVPRSVVPSLLTSVLARDFTDLSPAGAAAHAHGHAHLLEKYPIYTLVHHLPALLSALCASGNTAALSALWTRLSPIQGLELARCWSRMLLVPFSNAMPAPERAHLSVLHWRLATVLSMPWTSAESAAVATSAAVTGNLAILHWLRTLSVGLPRDRQIERYAAAHGQVEILEWLATQRRVYGRAVFASAVMRGQVTVLRWWAAQRWDDDEIGNQSNEQDMWVEAVAAAAGKAHWAVLEWLWDEFRGTRAPWNVDPVLMRILDRFSGSVTAEGLDWVWSRRSSEGPLAVSVDTFRQCLVSVCYTDTHEWFWAMSMDSQNILLDPTSSSVAIGDLWTEVIVSPRVFLSSSPSSLQWWRSRFSTSSWSNLGTKWIALATKQAVIHSNLAALDWLAANIDLTAAVVADPHIHQHALVNGDVPVLDWLWQHSLGIRWSDTPTDIAASVRDRADLLPVCQWWHAHVGFQNNTIGQVNGAVAAAVRRDDLDALEWIRDQRWFGIDNIGDLVIEFWPESNSIAVLQFWVDVANDVGTVLPAPCWNGLRHALVGRNDEITTPSVSVLMWWWEYHRGIGLDAATAADLRLQLRVPATYQSERDRGQVMRRLVVEWWETQLLSLSPS
ncbi:hypothetical protein BC828DRAFT_408100 [Blastocladiella britannica]|nr:hypothetical protein BC828DRAFT_408100 [Blastocladiella britannica]